jgi:hypothetical protein
VGRANSNRDRRAAEAAIIMAFATLPKESATFKPFPDAEKYPGPAGGHSSVGHSYVRTE